jgi:hypothetical protein
MRYFVSRKDSRTGTCDIIREGIVGGGAKFMGGGAMPGGGTMPGGGAIPGVGVTPGKGVGGAPMGPPSRAGLALSMRFSSDMTTSP